MIIPADRISDEAKTLRIRLNELDLALFPPGLRIENTRALRSERLAERDLRCSKLWWKRREGREMMWPILKKKTRKGRDRVTVGEEDGNLYNLFWSLPRDLHLWKKYFLRTSGSPGKRCFSMKLTFQCNSYFHFKKSLPSEEVWE